MDSPAGGLNMDALVDVWAKSPRTKEETEGETLTAHTAQVLNRLASWRDRYLGLAEHCRRDDLWDLAAWACLLHDAGKIAPGFQRMLRGGPRFGDRHEALSLIAVGWLDVAEDVRALVGAGVATHHKDLSEILLERYPFDPPDGRTRLLSHLTDEEEVRLRAWLDGEGAPDPKAFGFARLPPLSRRSRTDALGVSMRALAVLRQELSESTAIEPGSLAARFVRGLVVLADHAGSAHLRFGKAPTLDSVTVLAKRVQADLEARSAEPKLWPHQEACASVVGHAVLRAPTGSGKTEAALLWAARQRESGPGLPPIFYVLPYRASLNAMRMRIPERYGVPETAVVLQHSSATTSLYSYLLSEKGYTSESAARSARAAKNLGRLMTAPLRVLSPYQLLRAFFG
ncbi:MAG: CRISPR-associated endonuclease Cas3'', partial [Vicinamibacteria bacterium]